MKKLLFLLAACMLTWQVAPAQLMGNLYLPRLTGTHVDLTNYEGDGFKAEYYNGSNFEQKVFTRIDKKIDFFLINRSPASGINADYFSIRWSGKLYAPQSGIYTFYFIADDGVRLWVNNKLVIDRWTLNRATAFSGKISLTGKQVYDLKIEYSQMKPSAAVARASWAFEEESEVPINPKYVFSSTSKLPPVVTTTKTKAVNKPVVKKTPPQAKEASPKVALKPTQEKKELPIKPAEKKIETNAVTEVKKDLPKETFENLEAGKSIVLNHIFFDQSKHELRPESYQELDKLANTLKKYPQMKIIITGHTDNVGDFNLNVQLSKERAKAVAAYLITQGISSDRIEHKGYGGLYPVAANTTEESKKKNRRVEFAVR